LIDDYISFYAFASIVIGGGITFSGFGECVRSCDCASFLYDVLERNGVNFAKLVDGV